VGFIGTKRALLLRRRPTFVGVLDQIGVDASVACSVTYRLKTAYIGPLIRVRRASDNVEADIGYGANSIIDLAALSTALGGVSGFLVTMYDQSGAGRDLSQATTSQQPAISTLGVTAYDGVDDSLYSDAIATGVRAITDYPFEQFARYSPTTVANSQTVSSLNYPIASSVRWTISPGTGPLIYAVSTNSSNAQNSITGLAASSTGVGSAQFASATSRIPRLDGTTGANTDATSIAFNVATTRFAVGRGRYSSTTLCFPGSIQTALIFNQLLTNTQRSQIEAAI
jgi:hypothetical protein